MNSKIGFDTKNTLITNSEVGILLKRSARQRDLPNGCVWNEMSRLQQLDAINASASCPNQGRCSDYDNCAWGNANGNASKKPVYSGGIDLPTSDNPNGSGAFVISGEFGTGKSTLAFQLAAACVDEPNKASAVYITVEQNYEQALSVFTNVQPDMPKNPRGMATNPKCKKFSMGKPPAMFNLATIKAPSLHVGELALPKLPVRNATSPQVANSEVYGAFEQLVTEIAEYNKKEEITPIKMVVVDSLTVLTSRYDLTREEISALFQLFRDVKVIGVFTLEDRSADSEAMHTFVNDVKYDADVVITLRRSSFQDYYLTDIEIEKSRYVEKVQGRHPYKIRTLSDEELKRKPLPLAKKVLTIYPSAHHTMTAYGSFVSLASTFLARTQKNLFGVDIFNHILPQHLTEDNYHRIIPRPDAQIITITGSVGLYKSDLAINSLLAGLLEEKVENGLIIRLNEGARLERSGVRLNREVFGLFKNPKSKQKWVGDEDFIDLFESVPESKPPSAPFKVPYKYEMTAWSLQDPVTKETPKSESGGKLYEVIFKRGALLQEEMLNWIFKIVTAYDIQRVCLIDLKSIGVSYPFLIDSKTSGDMFLISLCNRMRVLGKDLIMTASPCGITRSDNEILRALNLSDTVVTCEREKNGRVTVSSSFDTITQHRFEISLCDENIGHKGLYLNPIGWPSVKFPMPMFKVERV